jgi:uncharacterized SAM-binding protein YcdF (DUF218 family)
MRLLSVLPVRLLLLCLCLIAVLPVLSFIVVMDGSRGTGSFSADCAIVFGAAVGARSLPGPAITRRVSTAADLYRQGNVKRLILSGGKGTLNRKSEAQVMKEVALRQGVPEEKVQMEDHSHSTWENLLNVRYLTEGCSSIVAISDGYHLARIRLLASRQGFEDLPTTAAALQGITAPEKVALRKAIVREVCAYMYYALYLDKIIPIAEPNDTDTKVTLGVDGVIWS